MEKITITTADNGELSGLLWNQEAFASVLLLHAMPALKESWVELADRLAKTGFNVLAIDFRGHGESDGGDYKEFTDAQHQDYILDAHAGYDYLRSMFPHTEIYLGGASIGANISLQWMAEHRDVVKGFMLSPGLDYYGVKGSEYIQQLDESQKVLLVGARDDEKPSRGNAVAMVEELSTLAAGQKETVVYDTGGHGTLMFDAHPELYQIIIGFLTK